MPRPRPWIAGLAALLTFWVGVARPVTSPTLVWPDTLPIKLLITFGAVTVDVFPNLHKQEMRITVGAQNENNNVQSGSVAFDLDNPDSHFTPDHPLSQYWPYVQLGVTVQVQVFWRGVWWTRFTGQVAEWKPFWPYGDLSNESKGQKGEARVSVVASGILRLMAQGKSPVRSPVYRTMSGAAAGLFGVAYTPLAYTPMEDGATATQFASGLPNGPSVTPTGPVTFASDGPPGSAPLIRAGAGFRAALPIPTYTDVGKWAILFAVSIPVEPAAATTLFEVPVVPGGTAARWKLEVIPGANAEIWWRAYDSAGALVPLLGQRITLGGPFQPTEAEFFDPDKWWMISVSSSQSGGNVSARIGFSDGTDKWNSSSSISIVGTHAALSDKVIINVDANLDGVGLGHFGVYVDAAYDVDFGGISVGRSIGGWAGERADLRLVRLCREFGIPLTIIGSSVELTGPQQIDILYNLLAACAAVDVGILCEDLTLLGLVYRCNRSLYNQSPALTLNARRNELTNPFRPTLDDLNVRNDVTVARLGGSEYRSVVKSGPKSIQAPPNGVGTYDERLVLNLYTDDQTVRNATWRTWRGTYPGMRYARISPDINASPAVADSWLDTSIGDLVIVTALPPQHPRTDVESLMRGYSETLAPKFWDVALNASPAGPYQVGITGDVSNIGAWLQTGDTTKIVTPLSPGANGATVWSDGPVFTVDPTDLTYSPLTVVVGGERISVGLITSVVKDAFGRSVSNGWGTPDIGPLWLAAGGVAADYSVTGTVGRISVTATLSNRNVTVDVGHTDMTVKTKLITTTTPVGAQTRYGVVARFTDANNTYTGVALVSTTGAITAEIRKIVAGVATTIASFATSITISQTPIIMLDLIGSQLRFKIWASTDPEPREWTVTATDTALVAGTQGGVAANRLAGNTSPTVFDFDDFEIVNPQRFTVTKSLPKIHAAGALLEVYRPIVAAL